MKTSGDQGILYCSMRREGKVLVGQAPSKERNSQVSLGAESPDAVQSKFEHLPQQIGKGAYIGLWAVVDSAICTANSLSHD